jgi:virginiamycin A acetyltransferase
MKNYIKYTLKNLFKKPSDAVIMYGSNVSTDSVIGDYTYIGFNCFVTKAEIGRYCSIANNISIGLGEHDLNQISTSSYFYDNAYQKLTEKKCTIGNDVWIGVDSIIRRGVTIGNGAVIGANSFVNQDVPDFAIVAGNPAKIIKYRFNTEQIEKINKSKWWQLNLIEAKKVISEIQLQKEP